ncbi:hypothetical protein [Fibrivirga algicola]|uniref:Uncharacterized protein n=1 Tax=Fibrivirga algicola TaxID=2950420 RepID=A0ABX0QA35_9BACT|nr:hypothetical protein [Fibrivirga algicola]NID09071.1 hypothetical protein [Fibrivirga algicola]
MDIVFQSGEFIAKENGWIDFLQQLTGALIGAGVALFTFYEQLQLNKKAEAAKRAQFEEDKLKYLSALLNQVVANTIDNVRHLDKFLHELSKEPVYLPDFGFVPNHLVERLLKTAHHEEYYHAYVNATREKADTDPAHKFIDIFEALSNYEVGMNNIITSVLKAADRNNEQQKTYQQQVVEVAKSLSELEIRLASENRLALRDSIRALKNEYFELRSDDSNLSKFPEVFLDPIRSILAIPEHYEDQEIIEIVQKVNTAKGTYNSIISAANQLSHYIEFHKSELHIATQKIVVSGRVLKNYGFHASVRE